MAASELASRVKVGRHPDAPQQQDLDKCVHCGLCLNACPTYRELGVEMDSPRGRIYQMVQVATGAAPITESYLELRVSSLRDGLPIRCPLRTPD